MNVERRLLDQRLGQNGPFRLRRLELGELSFERISRPSESARRELEVIESPVGNAPGRAQPREAAPQGLPLGAYVSIRALIISRRLLCG